MRVTTTKVVDNNNYNNNDSYNFFLLLWQGLLPLYLFYAVAATGHEANDPTNQNLRMYDLAWTCRTSEGVINRLRAPKWAPGASMQNRMGFGEPPLRNGSE